MIECGVPTRHPHLHRRNAAERSIRTFKNHLIASTCACYPTFSSFYWYMILPQVILTIDLLQSSHCNPSLSAHADIFGSFNFNSTPLVLPGTKLLIHNKPDNRKSVGSYGLDGWYIGPSLNYYRCYECIVSSTGGIKDADTVDFFLTHPFPCCHNFRFSPSDSYRHAHSSQDKK